MVTNRLNHFRAEKEIAYTVLKQISLLCFFGIYLFNYL
jgi:hypothetical protein